MMVVKTRMRLLHRLERRDRRRLKGSLLDDLNNYDSLKEQTGWSTRRPRSP